MDKSTVVPPIATWVFISDGGVHEEPVVQCYQLKESEARTTQIAETSRVHLAVQPSAYDGKYVCTHTHTHTVKANYMWPM